MVLSQVTPAAPTARRFASLSYSCVCTVLLRCHVVGACSFATWFPSPVRNQGSLFSVALCPCWLAEHSRVPTHDSSSQCTELATAPHRFLAAGPDAMATLCLAAHTWQCKSDSMSAMSHICPVFEREKMKVNSTLLSNRTTGKNSNKEKST